ncbi:MAG: LysR family transcriptional regulator [Acidimicrobiia bacterium]|nr:LysR family transcriptional regulator [Acidimicrobiia bacterium]
MDLRQLEILTAISQTGSFQAAADSLGTVQSNISAQLKGLENELRTTLIVRSRTGARLTEQGQVVVDRAKRINNEVDSMLVDLSMLQGLEIGHATIGVIGTASRWLVPSFVPEMRLSSPGVTLHVTEAPSERLLAEVLSHELSLAVVTEPVIDSRVDVTTLCKEELVGIAPVGYGLSSRMKTFKDIAKYPHVMTSKTNPLRRWIDKAATSQGVVLEVPVDCEGIRLIPRLVRSGVGCSILPVTALPEDMSNMVRYSIKDLPYRSLALISATDSVLSMAERVVSDVIIRLSK